MLSVPRESLLAIHSTNHWARTLLAQKPKSMLVLLRDLHGSTAEAPLKKDSKVNKRIRTDFKEDYIYDQTGRKLPAKFIKIRMWRREEKQKLSKAVHRNVYINGYVDWEQVARELDTGRSASLCRTQYQKMIIKEKGAEAAPLLFAKRIQTMVRSKYKLTEGTCQMNTLPLYKRTPWSPKDDDALLDYVAYLGPKWAMVSRHMEEFSPSQCRARYLRLTEQRKTKEDNTEGAEEPPADAKPPPPRRDWTSENDQRLFELIESGSGTKLQELLSHFPGFGRAQVYMALCRLRAGSKCKAGRWSADEHQRLLELVKQHGTEDWTLISEGMPAPKRLAIQCRSRYYRICVGRTSKWQKWTDDETQRLKRLVELYYLDKWVPAEQGSARIKGLESNNELLDMLEGEESMTLGNRLIRLVEAADHCDAKASPVKKRRYAKIPWSTISSLMLTRTASQCMNKWGMLLINDKNTSQPTTTEPWSLEEDVQLYKLYARAPKKWKWIMVSLPRKRPYDQIMRRYVGYISKYVKMLRKCRGPQWDPLADGFEEVHMRCDIWAWYRGVLIGYRAQDPQKCPYNLDFSGYHACGDKM